MTNNPDPQVEANIAATKRRARRKGQHGKRDLSIKEFSPVVVGLARGLLLAVGVGLMGGIGTVIQGGSMGKGGLVWALTTISTAVLRAIEGYLDKVAGALPSPRLLGGPRRPAHG